MIERGELAGRASAPLGGGGEVAVMTEAEWLAGADPHEMLRSLRGGAGARGLRLFAVACCRRVWPLLDGEPSRAAVEAAERFADELASTAELDELTADRISMCAWNACHP